MQVKNGDPIPLSVQLFDGNTGKYIKAIVRNPAGVQLAGSPVNLTHVGNGLYTDSSIIMPVENYVTSSYRVYDDAGYSIPSTIHSDTDDLFTLLVPVAELIEILSKVTQILAELSGSADVIGAIDDAMSLNGYILDSDELQGLLDAESDLLGELSDDTLIGIIDSGETTGEVLCTQGG